MIIPRWLVAIPIMVVASFGSSSAWGSAVLDRAEMFSRDAVHKANAQLEQLERATKIPVVIETIARVPGLDKNASPEERLKAINALAVERDNALKDEGIYLLISKNDHLSSSILVRERLASVVPRSKREAIGHAFLAEFKKKDFDGGLLHGVQAIERALEGAAAVGHRAATAPGGLEPVHQPAGAAKARGGQSAMGTFLLIILGIFGVLLVLRLVGGLFNRSAGTGYPGQMGGMGMPRPGMGQGGGPGYGGPGYGGRGGGFFSGMLGGLGGALAGNWLYDQFSGRHGGMNSADAVHSTDYTSGTDQGGDAIVGADDGGAGGGDWGGDGGGGADTGGGDWGGGGGDWGGGGGDWGGGGGGGDW
jgi:uncharacterized membrane protein YeaQ/YmgE (transglycosylase-associated protein family)